MFSDFFMKMVPFMR